MIGPLSRVLQELNDKRLTLVEGSALSERDLVRTRAHAAAAILLLADRFSPSAHQEDLGLQFQVAPPFHCCLANECDGLKAQSKVMPLRESRAPVTCNHCQDLAVVPMGFWPFLQHHAAPESPTAQAPSGKLCLVWLQASVRIFAASQWCPLQWAGVGGEELHEGGAGVCASAAACQPQNAVAILGP